MRKKLKTTKDFYKKSYFKTVPNQRSYISFLRENIESQYWEHPTGCGDSFGEILCYEIHENNLTFIKLANKWGISLPTLGDLIKDHCDRLQPIPKVNFN